MFQAGLIGHRQITTLPRKIESRGTRRDFPLKSPWKWVFAWSPRAVVAFSPNREKEGGSGWGKKKRLMAARRSSQPAPAKHLILSILGKGRPAGLKFDEANGKNVINDRLLRRCGAKSVISARSKRHVLLFLSLSRGFLRPRFEY